jgi:hypothetical protein
MSGAQVRVSLEQNDLKGPVKSIREYESEYERRGGKLVEGRRKLSSAERYDARGRQLSEVSYTDDGKILDKTENIYDASGRLVEARVEHDKFVYLPDRRAYVYDARGNVIEEIGLDAQGKRLGKYVYKYDERCRVIEMESSSEGRNQVYNNYRKLYTLDAEGRVIEDATFKVEGGTLKPEDFHLGYQRQVFLYDSQGRKIGTQQFTEEGKLFRTALVRYDDHGDEVEDVEYNSDGSVHKRTAYSYEFDSQGNWVKQVTSEWVKRDGKSFFEPNEVDYREITYFSDSEVRAARAKLSRSPARCSPDETMKSTDPEEYAVYSALVKEMFSDSSAGMFVISKFTSGYRTSEPDERQGLMSEQNFLTSKLDRDALGDYISKNRAGQSELLYGMLKLDAKHVLISDGETEEMFSASCEKGWEKFYKKYPGAQGHMTFSRVGFNQKRDAAVVYIGNQSHCLAGAGYLVLMTKDGGAWKVTEKVMLWIS